MKGYIFILTSLLLVTFSCKKSSESDRQIDEKLSAEVQTFLDDYTQKYLSLYTNSSEAEWQANTKIIENDSTNAQRVQQANEAFAAYTGSKDVIEKTRKFLESKDNISATQERQLNAILYQAANNPETVSEVVKERIAAENAQNEALFGYSFEVNGTKVSTGQIDSILQHSTDLNERLAYWNASKEVGKVLKDGLENLVKLRNNTVQPLGYHDYFSYQVSDYGYDNTQMMKELNTMVEEIWPLYRELHTWARYELAQKYQTEVPEYLPAHWLPNRWGQDWSGLVEVEGLDVDAALKDKTPEWIVQQGEGFYKSLGFPALPQTFYTLSDMYPLPADATYSKNNHASAWHMNLDQDVRCLMSITPTAEYYETVHHELGHIYYYLTYTNPDVPPLLRGGANRAFHEGVGSLLGLAASQKPFLVERGLIDANAQTDQTQTLLKEALNYVIFLPFAAGTMSNFERDLYERNLPKDQYNALWWKYAKDFQGIVPPTERGEEFCDAASKTHINNDAAQYYDYALSYILLFQIHDHISKNILKQDPHATNYYGSKETGDFLNKLLYPGANCDWNQLMEEELGSGLTAKPMLDYFHPLMEYLKEQNKGRTYTLPVELDF